MYKKGDRVYHIRLGAFGTIVQQIGSTSQYEVLRDPPLNYLMRWSSGKMISVEDLARFQRNEQ